MSYLVAILIGLAAAIVATYIFVAEHTWILYIAMVVLVVAGVVACLMPAHRVASSGIECDWSVAGGVRNEDLLCEELGKDTYRCYMPGANCQRAVVNVEAVNEAKIDWDDRVDDQDLYVKTKDKTYYISAEIPRDANDTSFVGPRDMPAAKPAYDLMSYPLIRAVFGSIIAGG